MDRYIVEARSTSGFPSLYSATKHGMFEIEREQATRFDHDTAKEIARREKALRPHRRILLIKVTD